MPISREEFETIDLRSFILAFLRSNWEQGFTERELMDEYASRGGAIGEEEFQSVLAQLVSEERVEKEEKKGVTYYIYYRPTLGFRRR